MNAIAITVLQHSFGNHQALCGASFTVAAGSIHGFVGPNGAGKTTCLRILATLLVPQQGQVLVFDKDVARDAQAVRRTIGFMPDHLTMYRQMTVGEYLDFFAAAYGLPPVKRRQVVHDVLALTDMGGRIDHPVKGLSRGMSQRVTLARVLVHDPQLLLLDEPASGLDPRARIELMEILKELQRLGKTVFISSHILSELADLCDEVTILDRGAVKYTGAMAGLTSTRSDGGSAWILRPAIPGEPPPSLALVPGVERITAEDGAWRIDLSGDDTGPLLAAALAAGVRIADFREARRHLNDAFMAMTTPGVRG